jgi:hypothetical protein
VYFFVGLPVNAWVARAHKEPGVVRFARLRKPDLVNQQGVGRRTRAARIRPPDSFS